MHRVYPISSTAIPKEDLARRLELFGREFRAASRQSVMDVLCALLKVIDEPQNAGERETA